MISLKSIKLQNFTSWVELELNNLDSAGLILINGINGTGKSSIRHAVEYLLLDTFSDDIYVDDIPFNRDTECVIEGMFQKDDSEIKIVKYRNHKKYKQSIELYLDGDDSLTHTDRSETQKEIFKLLGLDIFTVMTTSIYSSNSKSFIESTDSDRKDIIYKVNDLYKFNKGKENAKQKIKELTGIIEKAENSIISVKENLVLLEDDLNDVIIKIKTYESDKKDKLLELTQSIENIKFEDTDNLKKEIESLSSLKKEEPYSQKQLDSKIRALKNSKFEKELELEHLKQDIEKYKKEYEDAEYKLNTYDDEKQKKIKELEKELGSFSNVSYSKLENKIKKLKESKVFVDVDYVYRTEGDIKDYEDDKLTKEIELKNLRTEIKNVGDGKCPIFKQHLCNLLVEQKDKLIDECEPKIEKLEKDIAYLSSMIKLNKEELQELDTQKNKNLDIDLEIELLNDEIEEIKTENLLNKNKKENIENTIKNLIKEVNPYVDIKSKLIKPDESKVPIIETSIKDCNKSIELINKKLIELEEVTEFNNNIENKIATIIVNINSIENDNKIKQNNIDNIKNTITNLKEEKNPYTGFKCKIEKNIEKNKYDIANHESKCKEIFEECLYYKFWKKGFSKTGLPSMLSDNFLISLEDETNKILSSVSGQLHISIDPQKENKNKSISEKINIQIHHPDKKITSKGSYSAGQRQRVKISNIFALHKLVSNLDFMILDESLEGSLDEEGVKAMIDLLNTQQNEVGTIIVMSHNEQLKDSFENVINVDMKDGISCLA